MTVACSIVHFKGYVNKCIYQSFLVQINCKFIPDQFHFILTLFVAEKVLKKVCLKTVFVLFTIPRGRAICAPTMAYMTSCYFCFTILTN